MSRIVRTLHLPTRFSGTKLASAKVIAACLVSWPNILDLINDCVAIDIGILASQRQ